MISNTIKTFLLSLIILIGMNSCQTTQKVTTLPTINSDLVINNVNVIDAKNGLQTNRTILVKDNRIIKNVSANNLSFKPNSPSTIDGQGKYHVSFIYSLWNH